MPNDSVLDKMGITDDKPEVNLGPEEDASESRGPGAARRVFQPQVEEIEDQEEQEVIPEVVQPVKTFQHVEEYQLVDEEGKAIGPPQKFIGEGATELDAVKNALAKVRNAHQNSSRKLKEYRDKYRTMDTGKFAPEFKPEILTAGKRTELARKLSDPATVDEAFEELFSAKTGMKSEDYRRRNSEAEARQRIADAQAETAAFTEAHPEFPRSDEARDAIIDRLRVKQEALQKEKNDTSLKLEWNKHNLEIVYEELVSEGRLTPATVSSQETPNGEATPPVKATVPGAITPETPAARTRPRGTRHSSMTPGHSSVSQDVKQQQDDVAFLKEVNQMSRSALLQRIKSDRKFAARLDSIKMTR